MKFMRTHASHFLRGGAFAASLLLLSSCGLVQAIRPSSDDASRSQTPSEPTLLQRHRQGVAVYYPGQSVTIMTVPQAAQDDQIYQIQGAEQSSIQATSDILSNQMQISLIEADAHTQAGEERMREGNVLEAVREFERARVLIEEQVDPALSHIEGQAQSSGTMSVMSTSRIQGIVGERNDVMDRVNGAYNSDAISGNRQNVDAVDKLRNESRLKLTPISNAPSGAARSIVPVIRPTQTIQQPTATTPATTLFDIGEDFSGDIERNISLLQSRYDDFAQCLLRANQYFPQVTSILRAYGVPDDIAYIALVESGYQAHGLSRFGGAGLWQLPKAVARRYGLRVNSSRDERMSLEASTHAFARYISALHQQTGDWRIAVIRFSPQRDYLAKLIAVMRVAQDPQTYGFGVDVPNLAGYSSYSGQSFTQGGSGWQPANAPRRPSINVTLEPPAATLY